MKISEISEKVTRAHERISAHVHKTPLILSHALSELINGKVYLKCENEQYTGSFKARGSLNKVLCLTEEERNQGLITASTGNHALGFSRALEIVNAQGTVFLPHNASKAKIKALSYYPVHLERHGEDSLTTEIYAKEKAKSSGAIWMSPYNDIEVIAGQGTVGYEIIAEVPDIDSILVTVGGGGLISGAGSYIKQKSPSTKIIGCQPANSPEMTLSIEADEIVDLPEYIDTLSDGSAGGIEPDAITFDICRKIVDEMILIKEQEIKEAIRFVFDTHKKIIEGAAGVAVATLMQNPERFKGQNVVIILCGANIDSTKLLEILNG